MQTSSCLYPMSVADACAVAGTLNLNALQFYSEPSRFSGFLFENQSAAIFIKMRFSDAKRWPTTDDKLFLMYVERSAEVLDWIKSCGYEFEPVEIVAIQFASDEDQENFENVIWPDR